MMDGEWISVEDRLPDNSAIAIVGLRNSGVWLGWFYKGKWYDTTKPTAVEFTVTNYGDDLTVTHWMPLPEPPSEE